MPDIPKGHLHNSVKFISKSSCSLRLLLLDEVVDSMIRTLQPSTSISSTESLSSKQLLNAQSKTGQLILLIVRILLFYS